MFARNGYDANKLRPTLKANDTIPVNPGRCNRKWPFQYDERRYKDRWRVKAIFCPLKELASPACGSAASPTAMTNLPETSSQPFNSPSPSRFGYD